MKNIIALLSLLAVSAALAADKTAPAFSLPDTAGKTHNLSDFKGKYVVLEWFNPECPFVKKHYGQGDMQKLQKEFAGKDVVWLLIDSSAPGLEGHLSADEGKAQMEEWKINATALLLDPEGKVGRLYDAKTTPHMFVINPEGKIIFEGGIDDKRSTDQGDIASSKNYVRAALDEAMAGQPVSTPTAAPYGCSVKYKK